MVVLPLSMVRDVAITACELASIYGLVVLAVVIAFRIANFADLTMDGSFTMGGAVGAMLLTHDRTPGTALLVGVGCGCAAGVATGFFHSRVGINRLLAGIISMTILYSLNLRIMGRSNISLLDKQTVLDVVPEGLWQIVGLVVVAMLVCAGLWLLLRTELGHFMRATGENPRVVARRGFGEEGLLLISLALANGLSAFAGGLAAQHQGFADIGMGTGTVIAALTALLLGEAMLPPRTVLRLLLAALLGAFLYQVLVGTGLRMGLNPWDLKLATGGLLVLALAAKHRLPSRRSQANIGSDPL